MGQSTDGILFYGIAYGEDLQMDELATFHGLGEDGFDGDFDLLYANKMGVTGPTEEYTRNDKAIQDKYSAYWDAKREICKQGGCEVGTYCSSDYPMYYVCVKAGQYAVSRGSETEVPNGLHFEPHWNEMLQKYCELMGLPYSEPKWLLVSYWG